MSALKKTLLIFIGILILVFIFLNFASYSNGYRAGTPIKISKKGMIFKTYEGQMNIGGLTSSGDGVMPTQWDFSVTSSDATEVLPKIENAIDKGKRVKLYYSEKYVTFPWKGDTKYFVFKVEEIE
ncbi:MAG: hypothetical protein LPK80_10965 [Bacteroidota bacterium]|nr:hypothetical protein [Bacteroidota bacterium]MDX5428125.1 hypothetical protein [Bacteroidota bacterium]MDX5505939.1 hypothetical protein [Bacteroidota bacterium]